MSNRIEDLGQFYMNWSFDRIRKGFAQSITILEI